MSGLKIKVVIANILDFFSITDFLLSKLNKKYKNNYIRVLNYHEIYENNKKNFEKHLEYLSKEFINVTYDIFEKFMRNEYVFNEKPGLMITFDDGFKGNYKIAYPLLKKYHLTGYFFVSSDLISDDDGVYMNYEELKELMENQHIIGCHTCTHHRMDIVDTEDILNKEIVLSKKELEKELNYKCDIFCWVGGEENTYTVQAAKTIKRAGYKYSFMTNSYPVASDTNKLQIQRTNIDDWWNISLLKFQISGIIDNLYNKKRQRVNELTK